jgi:hypothetical protein
LCPHAGLQLYGQLLQQRCVHGTSCHIKLRTLGRFGPSTGTSAHRIQTAGHIGALASL